jgi:hypothetical protein
MGINSGDSFIGSSARSSGEHREKLWLESRRIDTKIGVRRESQSFIGALGVGEGSRWWTRGG